MRIISIAEWTLDKLMIIKNDKKYSYYLLSTSWIYAKHDVRCIITIF